MTNLLKSAIWYANRGWYVLPLHEPLFDGGACVGCSCEDWRRQNVDPDYICKTPGKHPRHRDWESKATTDVEQIARWWKAWPLANVGVAAGKSGLVVVDADAYKEGGELSTGDQQTVTSLTGGGGEHLVYEHPADGPPLGNAAGNLPAWIDIRGHGGLFVVPPSTHPSGRRYQWEVSFGPHELDPAPLPAEIRSTLTEAAGQVAEKITLGELEPINLGDLPVPNWVEALLTGDRSRIDACVITALVRAGATDNQIFYLFSRQAPTDKFSDKNGDGKRYLALSISNARAHLLASKPVTLQRQDSAA